MEVELSVIIVNYNGLRFLKDCFESLKQQLEGITYEIVVVDNASTDGSCDYISKNFPEIGLIGSSENLGFGKGNNLGVKNAKGHYILLLNNDTVLLSRLKPVLDNLRQSKNTGAVTINMVNGNREYIIPAGKFPNPLNLYRIKNMFNMGPEFSSGKFSKQEYEIDWMSGAFMIMPKSIYNEAGGFDEDYFMYVEDVDLCKKIADKGYKRIFLPGYSYMHYVGHNKSKDHYLISGLELYIEKHTKGINKFLCKASLQVNKTIKKIKTISR